MVRPPVPLAMPLKMVLVLSLRPDYLAEGEACVAVGRDDCRPDAEQVARPVAEGQERDLRGRGARGCATCSVHEMRCRARVCGAQHGKGTYACDVFVEAEGGRDDLEARHEEAVGRHADENEHGDHKHKLGWGAQRVRGAAAAE